MIMSITHSNANVNHWWIDTAYEARSGKPHEDSTRTPFMMQNYDTCDGCTRSIPQNGIGHDVMTADEIIQRIEFVENFPNLNIWVWVSGAVDICLLITCTHKMMCLKRFVGPTHTSLLRINHYSHRKTYSCILNLKFTPWTLSLEV